MAGEIALVTALPQIDAIRVLAMVAIFGFHLWSAVPEGPPTPALQTSLSYGYLGVVVFNMITGLVLALPTLGPEGRPALPYGAFLRRRFARIVPNYYAALGLWAAVAAAATGGPSMTLVRAVAAHLLFVQDLSPATFFAIVPAYWWIGLLAETYLVFPPLLRLYGRLGTGRATALLCAFGWGSWFTMTLVAAAHPGSLAALVNYLGYYNLPYRLPEFALGMWIAGRLRPGGGARGFARRVGSWPLAGLLLAVAAPALLPAAALEALPVVHVRLVAWCLVVFVGLLALGLVARVGTRPTIARMAAISYSFYLMHQPILGHGADLLTPRVGPHAAFAILLIGGGVLSLALASVLDTVAQRERRPAVARHRGLG